MNELVLPIKKRIQRIKKQDKIGGLKSGPCFATNLSALTNS